MHLIQDLKTPIANLSAYDRITSGGASHDLNQTVGSIGTKDAIEPMEIGALTALDIDIEDPDYDGLLEGIAEEQACRLAALEAGGRTDRLKCHYCNTAGHFIRNCFKRSADQAKVILRYLRYFGSLERKEY